MFGWNIITEFLQYEKKTRGKTLLYCLRTSHNLGTSDKVPGRNNRRARYQGQGQGQVLGQQGQVDPTGHPKARSKVRDITGLPLFLSSEIP